MKDRPADHKIRWAILLHRIALWDKILVEAKPDERNEMILSAAELIEYAEDEDIVVNVTYSGRGMYGKECIGVVGSAPDLAKFMQYVVRKFDSPDIRDNSAWLNVKQDNMGLDMIYYWPDIQAQ